MAEAVPFLLLRAYKRFPSKKMRPSQKLILAIRRGGEGFSFCKSNNSMSLLRRFTPRNDKN